MHNVYPQMGYYDKGLGQYVYSEAQMGEYPQMGSIFDDVANALTQGWKAATGSVETQVQSEYDRFLATIQNFPEAAKQAAIRDFLNTQTGQKMVEQAKQSWIQQQYQTYKTPINIGLVVLFVAGAGLLLYSIAKK